MGTIRDKITTKKRLLIAEAKRIPALFNHLLGVALLWLGYGLMLAGIYLFVTQVVLWMKSGIWLSMPLLYLFTDHVPLMLGQFTGDDLDKVLQAQGEFFNPLEFLGAIQDFTFMPSFSSWLMHPDEWIGVQKFVWWCLETLPASLAIVAFGFVSCIIGMIFSTIAEDRLKALDRGEN